MSFWWVGRVRCFEKKKIIEKKRARTAIDPSKIAAENSYHWCADAVRVPGALGTGTKDETGRGGRGGRRQIGTSITSR